MAANFVNKPKFFTLLSILCLFVSQIHCVSIDRVSIDDCPSVAANAGGDTPFYYDISQLVCRECAQTNEFQTISEDGKLQVKEAMLCFFSVLRPVLEETHSLLDTVSIYSYSLLYMSYWTVKQRTITIS